MKFNKLKLNSNRKIEDELATFAGDDQFFVINTSDHRVQLKKSFIGLEVTSVTFCKSHQDFIYIGTSNGT